MFNRFPEVKICEPGAFHKDDCNECQCSPDGLRASCRLKLCIPPIIKDNKFESIENFWKMCEPNSIFKNDCNQCKCSEDGRTVNCTINLCIPAFMTNSSSDTIKSPIVVCQPGKSFQDQCNDCKCSEVGTRALCTLKDCTTEREETNSWIRFFETMAENMFQIFL